jgi:3-oxoacyl-ACP reductase-like protein
MMLTHQGTIVRTTLDIDEDVLQAAREHAARERKSLGTVISALARDSLRRPPVPAGRRAAARRGGRFAVLPQRDEVITVEHIRGLRDAEGV